MPIALWRGFHEHGFRFFSSWSYTQDNWLFSLIPISSAVFAIFGATPQAALALGWGFFVASVGLAAWITSRLAGCTAGLALGTVLLFASYPALGPVGFLGYPISHNISMAWGLGAIVLALLGFERNAPAICTGSALAVFVNAVSDPWAGAAVALPIVVASSVLALVRRERRVCAAVLAVSSLIAFICARTRLFGLVDFLPPSKFELTDLDGMRVNLHWGAYAIARMFHIVPGTKVVWPGIEALDLLAFVVVAGGASVSGARTMRLMRIEQQFVAAVAMLSIGAVALLFLVGQWTPGPGAGRFFPNFYFLGAILLAVQASLCWRAWPRWARALVVAYAVLFALSGAAKRPDIWLGERPAPDAKAKAAQALGRYLSSQGLHYGYGPFWGTEALAMDAFTQGQVVVRPVSFADGRIRRRPGETSSLWFTPDAEPRSGRIFLVVMDDGEECRDTNACEAIADQQFGAPSGRLQYHDARILVWNTPLVEKIAP